MKCPTPDTYFVIMETSIFELTLFLKMVVGGCHPTIIIFISMIIMANCQVHNHIDLAKEHIW